VIVLWLVVVLVASAVFVGRIGAIRLDVTRGFGSASGSSFAAGVAFLTLAGVWASSPASALGRYDYDDHMVDARAVRDAAIRPASFPKVLGSSRALAAVAFSDWRYDAPVLLRVSHSLVATKTAGKACSFGGETRVLMADGSTKPISQVEVGDLVLAQDPETGEIGARRVTDAWVHDDDLVRLEIDGDLVRTTEDHPFWNDTDREWQRADQLDNGDQVLTSDGRRVKVGVLIGSAGRGSAYNFTVEGLHTYHVLPGTDAVLVHNQCRGLWEITEAGTEATRTGPFGKLYKSKSDGLWWSKDTAGHGQSAWKVYEETAEGLRWRADADVYGDFIVGKHKSPTGKFIPWNQTRK
jgi:hypothetical protein